MWTSPRVPYVAALLGMALTLPSLGLGLVQDDLTMYLVATDLAPDGMLGPRAPWDLFRFYSDAETVHRMRENGFAPWWTSDDLRLAFFRPLSSLWHQLDFALFGTVGWPQHLGSILAYGASVLAVGWALRRLEPDRAVAGLATLLWALDDAHGMAVGWLANRNAVLAWGLGALALGLHDRWRRDGWAAGAVLAPLAAASALGAGETALGAWAYLLSYAIFLQPGTSWTRALSVLPYGFVFLAWRAVYALGGYGASGSSFYVDPGEDPLAFLGVLPTRLTALLAALLGPLPADLLLVLPPAGKLVFLALALVSVLVAGWLLAPLLRERHARFWALGMLLSCVPMVATWPSERLLGFAGLGGFALVARLLRGEAPRVVKGGLVFVHVGMAALLLPLRSLAVAVPDAQQRAFADTMPDAVGRELVVVVSPDWFVPAFGGVRPFLEGQAHPQSLRMLASTTGPFTASRPDPYTLELVSAEGFLRDPLAGVMRQEPLRPGEAFTVAGWAISVLQTDGEGHPTHLRFVAPTPLDDPERVWTTWGGEGLVPFELP